MRVHPAVLGPMLVANMALLTVAGPSFGILASTLIDSFDITRGQVGQLNAGYAVVGALISPFTGALADRIGGRNLMTVGFVVAAVVFVLLGSATGFAFLLGAAIVSGAPNGMGNQGTNKYITAEVPVERRGVLTGIKQSGVMVGVFLAGLTLPPSVAAFGYSSTMFAVAGLAAVGAVLVRVLLPADPVAPRSERLAHRGPLPVAIRWLTTYAALMGAAIGAQSAFLALYVEEELAFSRSEAGLLVGLTGLVGIGARILHGRLTQTVDSYAPALFRLAAGATLSFVVIRLAADVGWWLVLATPVIAGFTTSSWNSPVMLASMRLAPSHMAGRSAGSVMFGFMSGYAIGPPLFGAAVDRLGSYDLPWLSGIVLCGAAAAVAVAWGRSESSIVGDPQDLEPVDTPTAPSGSA